jgi:hypothetical protein
MNEECIAISRKQHTPIALIIFCVIIISIASVLIARAFIASPLGSTNIVMSSPSPDLSFEAYVEEAPSIDPPSQYLYVEHNDKTHYMHVSHLAEDRDAIQDILWSPDRKIVVLQSRDCLTATRVSNWLMVRVYSGEERIRHSPHRGSAVACGPTKRLQAIEFPETCAFAYRDEGDENLRTIRMDSLVKN